MLLADAYALAGQATQHAVLWVQRCQAVAVLHGLFGALGLQQQQQGPRQGRQHGHQFTTEVGQAGCVAIAQHNTHVHSSARRRV